MMVQSVHANERPMRLSGAGGTGGAAPLPGTPGISCPSPQELEPETGIGEDATAGYDDRLRRWSQQRSRGATATELLN